MKTRIWNCYPVDTLGCQGYLQSWQIFVSFEFCSKQSEKIYRT